MENTCNNLVDYAYSLVHIVNKKYLNDNKFAYSALLFGIGNCKVERTPGSGHNYQAVIDAIHLYYADFPTSKVNVALYEGLFHIINNVSNMNSVQVAFNCITYEMLKEQNKTNTFHLDCTTLLIELRKKIKENYSSIKRRLFID